MHALFVSMSTDIGLRNPHVYLFGEQTAAERFAVTALIEAGVLPENKEKSDSDTLEDFQDELDGSEYFHVYNTTEPCQEGE